MQELGWALKADDSSPPPQKSISMDPVKDNPQDRFHRSHDFPVGEECLLGSFILYLRGSYIWPLVCSKLTCVKRHVPE